MHKGREPKFVETIDGVDFEFYQVQTLDDETGEPLEYWYWKRLDIPDDEPGQFSFVPADVLEDARIDARHEVKGLNYVTEAEVQAAIQRMRPH